MAAATKEQSRASHKFFSLDTNGTEANLVIYGDVTSWPWVESDVSSYNLSRQLEELDVDTINVGINSYGGEVGEGFAIYNALKRHRAKVRTRCDGFACSIASVIFMAGDERVMADPSMLMIHNAWTFARGDAKERRKQADDIEKMNEASVAVYMQHASIDEGELRALMDAETWISPEEAVSMGLATSVETTDSDKPSQSVREKVMQMLRNPYRMAEGDEEDPDGVTVTTDEEPEEPETTEEPETEGEEPEEPENPEVADEDEPETADDTTNPDDEEEPDVPERNVMQFLTAISRM